MIKSVIFDLDGTLLDTSTGVISSVKKTIEHYGFKELDREQLESFIGPPISKNMVRIYGVSEEEGVKIMQYFREIYTKGDIYRAEHYEGMQELLTTLKDRGFKVGGATYKREDMAQKLLEEKGLAKYFDVIHGADAYGRLTKADVVTMSIQDLGAAPEETVMVGDSENDAIGAKDAGALFVGVTYGFGFRTEEDIALFPNIGIAEKPLDILSFLD